MTKPRIIFLPENFNLADSTNQRPPQFSYKEDHFKYIIDLINDIAFRNKDRYKVGWVPLSSSILINYIRNYQHYLNYLQACGIIECDNHYIPNQKSKYYRLTDKYRNTPLKEDVISDMALIKKLSDYRYKSEEHRKADQRYSYLTRPFKSGKLGIRVNAAMSYLDATYRKESAAYKRGVMAIKRIQEQDWHFSTGSKNGRFYSNLTCMPKELRWFLTYEGHPLICIDVANMQAYVLNAFFKKNYWRHPYSSSEFRIKNINREVFDELKAYKERGGYDYIEDIADHINFINSTMLADSSESSHEYTYRDVWLYRELTTKGNFYSFMAEELSDICKKPISIEKAKKFVMNFINGDPEAFYYQDQTKTNPMTVFAGLFPAIYDLLYRLKVANYRHVSWLMQGMESKLILDIICKGLSKKYPGMPLFTIHDSIITSPDYADILHKEMMEQLELHVGFPPTLKADILDYDYMTGNYLQTA